MAGNRRKKKNCKKRSKKANYHADEKMDNAVDADYYYWHSNNYCNYFLQNHAEMLLD